MSKSEFTLAIVDDHNLFRKGLIKLIALGDRENRYSVLFEAENGMDLKEKLDAKTLPDIILMDINMPDMDGYDAVSWLRRSYPDVKVLVISMIETEEAVMRMLRMGVKGYLSKDIEVEDMHRALGVISTNGFYYSDFVTGIMEDRFREQTPEPVVEQRHSNALSQTELKFIELACTEMTYHQIADKMNLSPKTIDGYRESLFLKFKVKSRVSLAMYAVKNGLVKL